jgi:hypothetical protein
MSYPSRTILSAPKWTARLIAWYPEFPPVLRTEGSRLSPSVFACLSLKISLNSISSTLTFSPVKPGAFCAARHQLASAP